INQVAPIPEKTKELAVNEDFYALSPEEIRAIVGDGVFGGKYIETESVMRDLFEICVTELEDFLVGGWSKN
ncbi:MAG: hypothetical protein MUO76_01260, partial [Anaerolineaceae bacterium]|nr:hypothetical protein [Anaerolineaceae bacterium]